jgi:hypothetical protein
MDGVEISTKTHNLIAPPIQIIIISVEIVILGTTRMSKVHKFVTLVPLVNINQIQARQPVQIVPTVTTKTKRDKPFVRIAMTLIAMDSTNTLLCHLLAVHNAKMASFSIVGMSAQLVLPERGPTLRD